jgi:hypothetical protein
VKDRGVVEIYLDALDYREACSEAEKSKELGTQLNQCRIRET